MVIRLLLNSLYLPTRELLIVGILLVGLKEVEVGKLKRSIPNITNKNGKHGEEVVAFGGDVWEEEEKKKKK